MELPPNPPRTLGTPHGLGYYDVTPSQPASIQVISVFAIVFGSLIVLCDGLTTLSSVLTLAYSHSAMMAAQPQVQSTSLKVFGLLQAVGGFLLGGMLLAGGIGGVQVRSWARKLLIQWAVADLIFQVLAGALGLYFTLAVTMPAVQQQMNRQGRGMPPQFATYFSVGGAISIVVFTAIACILPICVLIFWRRPNVVAAFETPAQSFN